MLEASVRGTGGWWTAGEIVQRECPAQPSWHHGGKDQGSVVTGWVVGCGEGSQECGVTVGPGVVGSTALPAYRPAPVGCRLRETHTCGWCPGFMGQRRLIH